MENGRIRRPNTYSCKETVGEFRARTEREFHYNIGSFTPRDIEGMVSAYAESMAEEHGLDIRVVDAVLAGSRCRGLEKEGSDLDVVLEYEGGAKEDAVFNILNGARLEIYGVEVDINPITENMTGTLGDYLPLAEEYLMAKATQI